MAYTKQVWLDYDDTKSEIENQNNGAMVTADRMNHMENGLANSVDKTVFDETENKIDTVSLIFLTSVLTKQYYYLAASCVQYF